MGEWNDPARAFLQELGAAVKDIRAKLIDEGWFGRREPVAMRDIPDQEDTDWLNWVSEVGDHGLGAHSPSFEEAWARREPAAANEQGRDDKGFDFDR